MIIKIDSREQNNLEFNHPYITDVIIQKLDVGDYMCQFDDGYTPPISFERKNASDLFSTLSKGYKRFKKEIKRAQDSNILLVIIIECTLTKVLKGYKHSTRDGSSVAKQLFTLMVKHHVPFVACKDRAEMVEYITRVFIALGEEHIRKGENNVRTKKKS